MKPKTKPELDYRAGPAASVTDAGLIRGYAAVFGQLSNDLGGFREIIMPGAFDRALREKHDVRALVNHDSNQILGRTKSDTLRLWVDSTGLGYEITPPDTQAARDIRESIKRGDVDGSSFAFFVVTNNWRHQDGEVIHEVHDLELRDVSPVVYPAYEGTTVSARTLEAATSQTLPPAPAVLPLALRQRQQRQLEAAEDV